MGTLLAFTLACVGIIVLRRTAPELDRPFRTPGMPWLPVLGALSCVVRMVGLPWETGARLVIWLVLGMALCGVWPESRHYDARGTSAPTRVGRLTVRSTSPEAGL